MTVEEYQVAQLFSVAEVSKNETGGGEGIEVEKNEPFDEETNPPENPLLEGHTKGQYTHKIFYLQNKVPRAVKFLAPKNSLILHEKAWNAFPYCRTLFSNPGYMKDNFFISIESLHRQDREYLPNVHNLTPEELKQRVVVNIDIANDPVRPRDYKEEFDPSIFKSEKTNRGPLTGNWWENTDIPVMCCYKLVKCEFKWWGLQGKIEQLIQDQERKIFQNFHRMVHCWTDKWYGMTMEDIRALEDETKEALREQRLHGELRGTTDMD